MKTMFRNVQRQLRCQDDGYGNPQAWIDLPESRQLEICHERDGIDLFRFTVHCSEEEYDSGDYDCTLGVIDTGIRDNLRRKDFEAVMRWANRVCEAYPNRYFVKGVC